MHHTDSGDNLQLKLHLLAKTDNEHLKIGLSNKDTNRPVEGAMPRQTKHNCIVHMLKELEAEGDRRMDRNREKTQIQEGIILIYRPD